MKKEGIENSDEIRRNSERQINRRINKILQLGLLRVDSEKNLNGLVKILQNNEILQKRVKDKIKDI